MLKLIYMIINYNDSESVIKLIDQIKSYKSIDEILVVDNKSTDDSVKTIKKIKCSNLRIIVNTDNKGYASAINYGAKYVIDNYKDAYLVISNADIILSNEDDLLELVHGLDKKNVGIVAPTITEHGNLNRGWKIPSPNQEILENIIYFSRFFKKNKLYKDEHYKSKISEVEVVSGCFFIMKASTIEKVNYFDENTFLYYEEVIMARKLEKINYKSLIYNDILFIHNHSVSIDKSVKRLKKYKILKESQAYFEKNYNNANLAQRLFLWFTRWVTYLLLNVVYFIKDIIK